MMIGKGKISVKSTVISKSKAISKSNVIKKTAPAEGGVKLGEHKMRRRRAGTVALREIKRF